MTKNSLHSNKSLHSHYIKQHISEVITHRYTSIRLGLHDGQFYIFHSSTCKSVTQIAIINVRHIKRSYLVITITNGMFNPSNPTWKSICRQSLLSFLGRETEHWPIGWSTQCILTLSYPGHILIK